MDAEERCLAEIERCHSDMEHEPFLASLGLFDWFTELMFIRGELTGFKPRKD